LGYVLLALGRFSEAVAEFRAGLDIDPASWRALFGLADALAKLGQFEFSANTLMHLVQLKPELAVAHYQLGSVLARENRIAEALQALNNALKTGEKTGDAATARKSRELIEKLSERNKPPTATVPAPQ
jgi:tetratricopeptide (TPR) repeat protein